MNQVIMAHFDLP